MNMLIIRPGAIGDTLLTFPVLRALREKYSNPHITFVGNANVLPLALAFGLAETVSDYEHMQWAELFSTIGIQNPALREQLQRTDLAICWLRDPDGLLEHNLCAVGIKQLIIAPGRPPEGTRIHIVEYLARTVGMSIGPRFEEWNSSFMFCHPERSEGSLHSANQILRCAQDDNAAQTMSAKKGDRTGLESDNSLLHLNEKLSANAMFNAPIAIHPGSGSAQKCWPAHHFATVIKRLWDPKGLDGHSHSVLLLGGPADQKRVHGILNSIGDLPQPGMLKVLQHAPLLELAQQLQQCPCYLGNDSGITHLAAMLGIPTVALFGPSDPAIWHPPGPWVRVIRAQVLEQLDPDVVIDALEASLSMK